MRRLLQKHKTAGLLAVCYGVCLALLLVWHLGLFVYNRVLHAGGTLQTVTLGAEDFELRDMVLLEDGTLVTVGDAGDPQMHVRDAALRADSLLLVADFASAPGMVSAYWAKDAGADHSVRRMSYAKQTAGGWLMLLPAGGGAHLRIDPDVFAGNLLVLEAVVLNPPRGLWSFMRFSAGEWALLLALPLLAASALSALRPLCEKRKGGKAV